MKPDSVFTIGWLLWIFTFLLVDFVVWLHRPAIPTFSQVITRVLPWWVVIPAATILAIHLAMMYRK